MNRQLLPSGTKLSDVPPEANGITWDEYHRRILDECVEEAVAAAAMQPTDNRPIATARDRYGWRSLPSSTPYFGKR